jgi:hypothetical protein
MNLRVEQEHEDEERTRRLLERKKETRSQVEEDAEETKRIEQKKKQND